ncbi:hypothetical protein [Methylobacterium sp. SI9]|uniref:hypothetical protein n=1 Tax=Methylobacterium guangdongense TaxID=3138811 RepID=UPI00313C43FF
MATHDTRRAAAVVERATSEVRTEPMELKLLQWMKRLFRDPEREALIQLAKAEIARSVTERAFAFALLKGLVDRETFLPDDAASICRFVADTVRDNPVLKQDADAVAKEWDRMALIFEPREPGPPPPGYEMPPPLDQPIGPIRPSRRYD